MTEKELRSLLSGIEHINEWRNYVAWEEFADKLHMVLKQFIDYCQMHGLETDGMYDDLRPLRRRFCEDYFSEDDELEEPYDDI